LVRHRGPIDEFDIASRLIANVHVKDILPFQPGTVRPTFVPAGEGITDYRVHFAALRKAGFGGTISLEPHMDGQPETIRRCKNAVEQLWNDAVSV
jgi:sugar phosphate isomerase/epimerase